MGTTVANNQGTTMHRSMAAILDGGLFVIAIALGIILIRPGLFPSI